MRVLLVTSWDTACGIAEFAYYLKTSVEAADPSIAIDPRAAALHPGGVLAGDYGSFDLTHLNYHGALHSLWTAETIQRLRDQGQKVIVTFHDTGVPNCDTCKAVCATADAFVVHEPYDDLEGNGHYWRMGVPDWPRRFEIDKTPWHWDDRPILGSIGFPFPWKNFDLLAKITAELGWAFLLIAPTASADYIQGMAAINPHCFIDNTFVPRGRALAYLRACDATAFPYVCHNTGQSAAILQGIAARKPVYAFSTCRQFRALYESDLGSVAIGWSHDVIGLKSMICNTPIARCDGPMVALAEEESWAKLGQKYADLYKAVVGG